MESIARDRSRTCCVEGTRDRVAYRGTVGFRHVGKLLRWSFERIVARAILKFRVQLTPILQYLYFTLLLCAQNKGHTVLHHDMPINFPRMSCARILAFLADEDLEAKVSWESSNFPTEPK